jgi:hypothetical protein
MLNNIFKYLRALEESMDFWSIYESRKNVSAFGKKQFLLNTGERYNTSLASVKESSLAIDMNVASYYQYTPGKRYVIAGTITFDLLVSFYDTNSRSAVMMRLTSPMRTMDILRTTSLLRRIRHPNIELRLIGLQNNDSSIAYSIKNIKKMSTGKLAEADLFGDQIRHVAIDMLTGKPYSLLLENRIYRPGELNNTSGEGDFQKNRSELHFV